MLVFIDNVHMLAIQTPTLPHINKLYEYDLIDVLRTVYGSHVAFITRLLKTTVECHTHAVGPSFSCTEMVQNH